MIFLPDPLLHYIVNKLAEAAFKELKHLRDVSNEIAYISTALPLMKAGLPDDSLYGSLNRVNKEWAKGVKDVALRADMVLELYTYEMALVASKRSGNIFKIWSIPTVFFKKAKLRHDLHRDLVKIKVALEVLSKYRADFHLPPEPEPINDVENYPYAEKEEVVGIDDEVRRILYDIKDERKSHLITVYGPGGSGKTTLVRRLYKKIVESGFDCHAWAYVPQKCVIETLLRKIATDFYTSCGYPEPSKISDANLGLRTHDFLRQQERYVLVLDNVWDDDVLKSISHVLPQDGSCSSIIIVTTRQKTVAWGSLTGRPKEYRVKPLTPEFGWDLFCRVAFKYSNPEGQCPKNLVEVGKTLLSKCQGLPLAVVAIANLIATEERDIEAWKEVKNTISPDLPRRLADLNQCLLLSYNRLQLDLKYCALYFALLPKGMPISRKKLIRMWIAEGFIIKEPHKTLEDTGKSYFIQLVDKSMIIPVSSNKHGEPISGVMHDVMHDVIANVASTQHFGTIVSCETEHLDVGQRRLSLLGTEPEIQNVITKLLRSFHAFECGGGPTSPFLYQLLLSVKLLRVLVLEGVKIGSLPSRLGDLIHLRYLSVRKTHINTLPKSLGKLHFLQTLDVRETAIVSLPKGISQLLHLRHLLAKKFQESKEFTVLPMHSLEWKQLQTLTGVDLSPILLKKLDQMTQLRKLQVSSKGGVCWTELCHSVAKMAKLQSLKIQSAEGEQLHLGSLSPPASLRKLALKGIFNYREEWIRSHDNIQVL